MSDHPDNIISTFDRIELLIADINAKFSSLHDQIKPNEQPIVMHDETLAQGQSSAAEFVKSVKLFDLSGQESTTSTLLDGSSGRQCHRHQCTSSLFSPSTTGKRCAERDLFIAANNLCTYLNGGIDYRHLCLKYQRMFEMLIDLIKEDVNMLRSVDPFSAGSIEEVIKTLRGIYLETRSLLEQHGIVTNPQSPALQKNKPCGVSCGVEVNSGELTAPKTPEAPNDALSRHTSDGVGPINAVPSEVTTEEAARQRSPFERVLNGDVCSKPQVAPKCADKERYSPLHFCNSRSRLVTNKGVATDTCAVGAEKEGQQVTRDAMGDVNNTSSPNNGISGLPSAEGVDQSGKEEYRRNALRFVYKEMFTREGVNMLYETLQLVLENEYGGTVPESLDGGPSQLARYLLECHSAFAQRDKFMKCGTPDDPTLTVAYVQNCFRFNVEPDDRVLGVLGYLSADKRKHDASFVNMGLRDEDLRPLIPLLSKLHYITVVDISHNNVTDIGVQQLCNALVNHPTLKELNISYNPVTEASAEALLKLTSSAAQLTTVKKEGIKLSASFCDALKRGLHRHRRANNLCPAQNGAMNSPITSDTGTSHTPPVVVLNGVGYKWQRIAVPDSSTTQSTQSGCFVSPSRAKPDRMESSRDTVLPALANGRTRQGVRLPYITARGRASESYSTT